MARGNDFVVAPGGIAHKIPSTSLSSVLNDTFYEFHPFSFSIFNQYMEIVPIYGVLCYIVIHVYTVYYLNYIYPKTFVISFCHNVFVIFIDNLRKKSVSAVHNLSK